MGERACRTRHCFQRDRTTVGGCTLLTLSFSQQTLAHLFIRQRRALVGMLARIVGNHQTAEDLAQEAYVRVAVAEREQPIGALRAFLFRTARNLALDHLRAERMHGTVVAQGVEEAVVAAVPANQPTPETQVFDRERLARLEMALAGLKPRRREILVLHKLHGWTYARIAGHLGITESAVQKNVVLALAECLTNLPDDPP